MDFISPLRRSVNTPLSPLHSTSHLHFSDLHWILDFPMVVPVTSSIVTLRCLVRCFQSFCGRFVDQEMVLARNFCCRSIFQKTLKQFEPAVSELFEEHLLVRLTSRRTRRVCLGHAICLSEVRLTSRLFTVKTLLFFPEIEYGVHFTP